MTFNETVVTLLELHNADKKLINHYLEETTDEISDLFEVITSIVKQKHKKKYRLRLKKPSR